VSNHAEHFLRRIDRLDLRHAELALALYRDEVLLREVLAQLELPAGAERVAIALEDPKRGPFVIVTREARFVTCLAEGMRIGPELPVVTRAKLEAVGRKLTKLRDLLGDIGKDTRREMQQLFMRIGVGGESVTREEFASVARFLPLLHNSFLASFAETLQSNAARFERLRRPRDLHRRKHEHELHAYWQEVWALGHYALLLGSDGGDVLKHLASLDPGDGSMLESMARTFTQGAALPAIGTIAIRGAWLVSRAPEVTLGPLKRAYTAARDLSSTLTFGCGLCAIALRHRDYRAEVAKVLERTYEHDGDRRDENVIATRGMLHQVLALSADVAPALREQAVHLGRAFLDDAVASGRVTRKLPPCPAEGWPEDIALSGLTSSALIPMDKPSEIGELLQWLPWIVRLEADQFYLPEAYGAFHPEPFQPALGVALIEPRLRLYGRAPATELRAATKPGRNDPCPCGSGKKHKRCCCAVG
jgi:hypothetical protein